MDNLRPVVQTWLPSDLVACFGSFRIQSTACEGRLGLRFVRLFRLDRF
jgi:hypothetical protein